MAGILTFLSESNKYYQELHNLSITLQAEKELTLERIEWFIQEREQLISRLKALESELTIDEKKELKQYASSSPASDEPTQLWQENKELNRLITSKDQALSLRFAKVHQEIKEKARLSNTNRKAIQYGQYQFTSNYLDPGTRYNRLR